MYTGIYRENNKVLVKRIADAEGVLVSYNTRIDREVIEACPSIRYIGMCCTLYSEQSAMSMWWRPGSMELW